MITRLRHVDVLRKSAGTRIADQQETPESPARDSRTAMTARMAPMTVVKVAGIFGRKCVRVNNTRRLPNPTARVKRWVLGNSREMAQSR